MSKKRKDPLYYELERIAHKDLSLYRKRSKAIYNYLREHYYYFAEQGKNIFDVLQDSIRRNSSVLSLNITKELLVLSIASHLFLQKAVF